MGGKCEQVWKTGGRALTSSVITQQMSGGADRAEGMCMCLAMLAGGVQAGEEKESSLCKS